MPKREHIERLKESSVKEWNEWRAASPKVRPDLSEAVLEDVHLVDLDLRGVNMSETRLVRGSVAFSNFADAELVATRFHSVDLTESDFSGAHLRGAVFLESPFRSASFNGADLHAVDFLGSSLALDGTDFRRARLASCRLDHARLLDASLQEAMLRQVSLRRANLDHTALEITIFSDCDLSAAHLESALHLGPSVIDQRTLARSGPLPRVFLRGCGYSEEMVDAVPRDVRPVENFCVAYALEDREFASRLREDLQAAGIRCWLYPMQSETVASRWSSEGRLLAWDHVLLILSESSEWSLHTEQLAVETLEGWRGWFRPPTLNLFAVQIGRGSGGHVTDIYGKLPIEDFRAWQSDPEAYERALASLIGRIRGR